MKILQSRSFERKVNKFSKQDKNVLDKQVVKITENPSIGAEKKGDLRGVYVHKFKKLHQSEITKIGNLAQTLKCIR
ncbi:MAG: type II toxin-antitoxin system RelE/ParE family toxin [Deltaproteobacteria bacterium]|nr:type II toxin-antitoxin system RelE/ParE family toxin [Deltaproteobacteria bacterium]